MSQQYMYFALFVVLLCAVDATAAYHIRSYIFEPRATLWNIFPKAYWLMFFQLPAFYFGWQAHRLAKAMPFHPLVRAPIFLALCVGAFVMGMMPIVLLWIPGWMLFGFCLSDTSPVQYTAIHVLLVMPLFIFCFFRMLMRQAGLPYSAGWLWTLGWILAVVPALFAGTSIFLKCMVATTGGDPTVAIWSAISYTLILTGCASILGPSARIYLEGKSYIVLLLAFSIFLGCYLAYEELCFHFTGLNMLYRFFGHG